MRPVCMISITSSRLGLPLVFGQDSSKSNSLLLLPGILLTSFSSVTQRDAIDLTYTPYLNFPNHSPVTRQPFTYAGPGARKGLKLIFKDFKLKTSREAIDYLAEHANTYFARLGLVAPEWDGRGIGAIEVEHALCELHKYTKLKSVQSQRSLKKTGRYSEGPGRSGVMATPKRFTQKRNGL